MLSQTIVPIIPIVIKIAPPLGPSPIQYTKTVMEGRYAPLVLPDQLNAMHVDYLSKIVNF